MTATTGQFASLLAPGLKKVYYQVWKEWPEEYVLVLNVINSSKNFEEFYNLAGLPITPQKPQGVAVSYGDLTPGNTLQQSHTSYGQGFRVTREMRDDDLYNVIKAAPKDLAVANRQRVEAESVDIYNDAFTGANRTCLDSVALCSTSHTLLTGGTASNRLATDSDLAVLSLQTAMTVFEQQVNENGFEIMMTPSLLITAEDERFTVEELLAPGNRPYTSDNTKNVLASKGLQGRILHKLSDTDAWFLQANPSDTSLFFVWRIMPEFSSDDDFDTGDAKFKTYLRFSIVAPDWRGIVGTPGA